MPSSTVIDGLAAVGSLAAAVAAAVSAWVSSRGAKASMEAVNEARLARRAELLPRLVLEKDFLDFAFQWPHPSFGSGEPAFLARRHWKDDSPVPPTFSLTNHGGGPALELQLIFELEDPNGELAVPHHVASCGLSVTEFSGDEKQGPYSVLEYQPKSGDGIGLPLYQKFTMDISSCAPNQTRRVEFPMPLLNRLFLRGLQSWQRKVGEPPITPVKLSISLSCHSVEGENTSSRFLFEARPFYAGRKSPMVVHGHFRELPVFPKRNGPRVA